VPVVVRDLCRHAKTPGNNLRTAGAIFAKQRCRVIYTRRCSIPRARCIFPELHLTPIASDFPERGLYEPQQASNLPACRIFPERHPTPIASYSRALLSPRTGPLRTPPGARSLRAAARSHFPHGLHFSGAASYSHRLGLPRVSVRGLYEPQQAGSLPTRCIFSGRSLHSDRLALPRTLVHEDRSAVSMSRSKPAVSQRAAFSQDAHCIPIASHFRGPWSTRTGARSLGAAASRQSPNALHFLRTLIALRSPRTSADLGPRGSERGLYEPQQAGNLPACRIFPERHPTPIASYSRALLSPRTGPLRTSPDRGLYEPQHAGNLPACRIFPQRHPTPIASDSRALLFPRTWPAHPPPERGLYEPQQGRTFPTVCIYRSFVPSLRRNACRSAK